MFIEKRIVLLDHATSLVTKIYAHPKLGVVKKFIYKLSPT